MALSTNPLGNLVSRVSTQIKSESAEKKIPATDPTAGLTPFKGTLKTGEKLRNINGKSYVVPAPQGNVLDKAKLDQTVARNSGSLGSGMNQFTAGGLKENFTTAMGEVNNVISDIPGGENLSSLTDSISGLIPDGTGFSAAGADLSSALSKLSGGDLAGGATDLASSIAKGAGALNDILSVYRGQNIPADADLFATTGQSVKVQPTSANDWRVRIDAEWQYFSTALFDKLKATGGVVFPIQPQVTFATKANYTQLDPVHNNYPFQAYKNSQVDEIMITGEFPVETELDAAYWIAATTFFRTVTKMFFGKGENAGNPPIICGLHGYGASVFDNVPVVVTSFSTTFPEDVNYIKCNAYGTNTWVPALSSITVNVKPVYNRRNLRQFSLKDYSAGKLQTNGRGYI